MITSSVIGAVLGSCLGVGVVSYSYYLYKRRTTATPDGGDDLGADEFHCPKISYADLVSFAVDRKSHFPEIVKCRVVCENKPDGKIRVIQLMLNSSLVAIKTSDGDVVGRIVSCDAIDQKVRVLCNGRFPATFDFVV